MPDLGLPIPDISEIGNWATNPGNWEATFKTLGMGADAFKDGDYETALGIWASGDLYTEDFWEERKRQEEEYKRKQKEYEEALAEHKRKQQ